MNQIRDWLYIGGLREAQDEQWLKANGVGAVLHVASDTVSYDNLPHQAVTVEDDMAIPADSLREGLDFIREQREAGRAVLVVCGLGVSRSVSFATAALKEAEGTSLIGAYQNLRARHSDARPHPALWQGLCDYFGEQVHYLEVMRANRQKPAP